MAPQLKLDLIIRLKPKIDARYNSKELLRLIQPKKNHTEHTQRYTSHGPLKRSDYGI